MSSSPLARTQAHARVGVRTPRTLYVAAAGGHLSQLTQLAPRITPLGAPLWVTFDEPQSRSLLRVDDVTYVRFTAPRDVPNVTRNLAPARRLMRDHDVVEVISTGSAIALSFLPLAVALGIPCHYIESAARSEGPSITGRVLERLGGVQLYTQYRTWNRTGWTESGSVFDQFSPVEEPPRVDDSRLRVLVSLGTMRFRFDRMVRAVLAALPAGADVTWQVGPNYYGTLPGRVVSMLPADEFAGLAEQADVIVSHAGVGSALTALRAGRHPVLVPRDHTHDEHIDGHQRYIGHELHGRGLATPARPEELTAEMLVAAAHRRVTSRSEQPAIVLRRPGMIA